MPTTSDSIVKETVIKAPRSRVWNAITDSRQFATWFGSRIDGDFVEGRPVACIANCDGKDIPFEIHVEKIEPETLFAYRWHPTDADADGKYGAEPMTLVEFRLEDDGAHTKLTIIESGFDAISIGLRDEAFRRNEGGWAEQIQRVTRHVEAQ